jgi:HUS1 checkpoint protein
MDDDQVRFTVIPAVGSQVWATFSMEAIFENYHIQSAEPGNTINLELPIGPLQRALRSAITSTAASVRLTKRDGIPVLSFTIHTTTHDPNAGGGLGGGFGREGGGGYDDDDGNFPAEPLEVSLRGRGEREKIITHDIPVRVLHPDIVEGTMQPNVREPDVHIRMPPLLQLKAISDRFTKLASTSATTSNNRALSTSAPRLELSANMHGQLKLRIKTDSLDVESTWDKLEHPELEPSHFDYPIENHPCMKFKAEGPDKWATVRVDGKDWSRVLGVGRLDGRVIACFSHDNSLILYVYVPQFEDAGGEESVVTYYVSSYSA